MKFYFSLAQVTRKSWASVCWDTASSQFTELKNTEFLTRKLESGYRLFDKKLDQSQDIVTGNAHVSS